MAYVSSVSRFLDDTPMFLRFRLDDVVYALTYKVPVKVVGLAIR